MQTSSTPRVATRAGIPKKGKRGSGPRISKKDRVFKDSEISQMSIGQIQDDTIV
jgi:hypothetical protein